VGVRLPRLFLPLRSPLGGVTSDTSLEKRRGAKERESYVAGHLW